VCIIGFTLAIWVWASIIIINLLPFQSFYGRHVIFYSCSMNVAGFLLLIIPALVNLKAMMDLRIEHYKYLL